jgi:hypothetical protein
VIAALAHAVVVGLVVFVAVCVVVGLVRGIRQRRQR